MKWGLAYAAIQEGIFLVSMIPVEQFAVTSKSLPNPLLGYL